MPSARVEALQQENAQLTAAVSDLTERLAQLQRQVDWFTRQLFGSKSERRLEFDESEQASLFAALGIEAPPAEDVPTQEVSYRRREKRRDGAVNESGLRFDGTVPVETVVVTDPAIEAIPESEREVVGEKVTHRLAQEPGSHKVLKYVRPVVKRRDTGELLTPPSPPNVLDRTCVDVSFLSGMLVDKFRCHLPLHRQHQRLADAGIQVSRSSLTNWAGRAIDLLEPVAAAQAAHILEGSVVAMDETSIKAGRVAPGRMRAAYFWPVFGEDGEIAFHYAPSRAHRHVEAFLGNFRGTLLSDGYAAYDAYARRQGIAHAQCWAHCRRNFTDAGESDPAGVSQALSLIGALYVHEKAIRRKKLEGPAKLALRRERSAPAVDAFFAWCAEQRQRPDLLPSSPFSQALQYVAAREAGLRVFLEDLAVSLDTNHLERGLRPVPMGRRNWLFAWTELGARRVGVIQSLLATCKLQDVDAHAYLVDVLQRVGRHPAKRAVELTPRVWKTLFADRPLRSDLDRARDPPPP
ncbi:MAG: IS66 family transposase [Gammaproteobacteria bacterium]|nr:IS66 family transposase [Gammaproteobacteria bacterium]